MRCSFFRSTESPFLLGVKIYNHYGERIYGMLKENPYRMAEEIQGSGLRLQMRLPERWGYIPIRSSGSGAACSISSHRQQQRDIVICRRDSCCTALPGLLGIEVQYIEKYIMDLAIERKVVLQELPKDYNPVTQEEEAETAVYAAQYYYLELNAARMLCELNVRCEEDEGAIRKKLENIESTYDYSLDERQRQAVVEAVGNGLLILTGGPGTGKTTTINAVIRYFASEQMDICLAAPTGRAAKRMTEATGYEAQTIHRLLELSGGVEESSANIHFERNEQNPVEADVVIIDEMSMVDIHLMHALLSAVTVGTRLILVGDMNQPRVSDPEAY